MSSPAGRLTPRAALLLSLAPLFWAGNALVGRMVYPLIPPMTLNFLRWVLAGLLLLPLARWVLRPDSAL
jgi:drug/metabolite transporter (DMT)-like permease